jgi:hypothetical protein
MRSATFAGIWLGSAVVGCAPDEGSFELRFVFGDLEPPTAGTVDVYGTLFAPGQTVEGNRGEPVPYEPGVPVAFEQVPFGSDLVVEVRMFPTGSPPVGAPTYFGSSDPFDFQRGERKVVDVDFSLQRGPRLNGGGALTVLNVRNGRVRNSRLELETEVVGATTLEVAQDLDFSLGLQVFELPASLRESPAERFRFSYDLNATRDDCRTSPGEMGALRCQGERRILVRGLAGRFASDAIEERLVLDATPPQIAEASRTYVASQSNPLERVQAATATTTILINVNFTEILDGSRFAPTLVARDGESSFELTLQQDPTLLTNFATFSVVIDPTVHLDGVYVPWVEMQDLAGNRATVDLSQQFDVLIEVDTTADRLAIDQTAVSFIRSPVGNRDPEILRDRDGGLEFTIPGGVTFFELGPADGLSPVSHLPLDTFVLDAVGRPEVLRFWAEEGQLNLLGTARYEPGLGWPRSDLQLVNLDTPRVYATGLDRAGNESPPELVENAWYVGSSARIPGSSSPHRLETAASSGPPLLVTEGVLDLERVSSPDGESSRQTSAFRWNPRLLGAAPKPRVFHASAYDSARGRMVVFGGQLTSRSSDTWEWDGQNWRDVTPGLPRPSARASHAMTYDSVRGRVVLFGGQDSSFVELRDTWTWDGRDWFQVTSSVNGPVARTGHALAFDSRRGRVVMFGGRGAGIGSSGPLLDDTWEWDGETWRQVSVEGPRPSPRTGLALVYDSLREEVILFGGNGPSGALHDTWTWDGRHWRRMTPMRTPSARGAVGFAFDIDRGVAVLFGGSATGEWFGDTWEWDGSTWRQRVGGSTSAPSPRGAPTLVFDSSRGRTILFGGRDDSLTERPDVWEWNGTEWAETTPRPNVPQIRSDHSAAFDDARGRIVMFGGFGFDDPNLPVFRELWELDARGWEFRDSSGPEARYGHALAYDQTRDQVVVFGGTKEDGSQLSDTWLWNATAWTPDPASFQPSPRSNPSMAYDSRRDRIVLVGGGRTAETWEWDGTRWLDVTPASNDLPTLITPAIAFDAARGETVLFGGRNADSDFEVQDRTWTWDGTSWKEVVPVGPIPKARSGPAMAYVEELEVIAMFGGVDGEETLNDSWQWNGAEWSPILPEGIIPSGRRNHTLTRSAGPGAVTLFGGLGARQFDDTWDLSLPTSPLFQFRFRLPSDLERDDLVAARIRAFCSGRAEALDGQRFDGAVLQAWIPGGAGRPPGAYVELDANEAPLRDDDLEFPPLEYDSRVDARALDPRDLVGPDRTIYTQCRPRLSGTTRSAEAALDYVEVRLKYQAHADR